jgi:predicted RNase H-like HicB family nuclease
MKHYLAVLVPTAGGGWRAHFPDFPGCRAEGHSVEDAITAASTAASEQAHRLRTQGVSLPPSRSYEDVRLYSNGWAEERGIAWSDAVISLVPLALQHDR